MVVLESLEQARWIAVVLQKTGQNPADCELKIQKLRRWLLEVILDVGQAGAHGFAMGEHETLLSRFYLTQSHSDFQAVGESSSLQRSEW